MTIQQHLDHSVLTLTLEGRLDTTTAPQLSQVIETQLDGVTGLILDFGFLEYISSAGLRVLLVALDRMEGKGDMKVIRVNETIMEIFEITGFTNLLTIE